MRIKSFLNSFMLYLICTCLLVGSSPVEMARAEARKNTVYTYHPQRLMFEQFIRIGSQMMGLKQSWAQSAATNSRFANQSIKNEGQTLETVTNALNALVLFVLGFTAMYMLTSCTEVSPPNSMWLYMIAGSTYIVSELALMNNFLKFGDKSLSVNGDLSQVSAGQKKQVGRLLKEYDAYLNAVRAKLIVQSAFEVALGTAFGFATSEYFAVKIADLNWKKAIKECHANVVKHRTQFASCVGKCVSSLKSKLGETRPELASACEQVKTQIGNKIFVVTEELVDESKVLSQLELNIDGQSKLIEQGYQDNFLDHLTSRVKSAIGNVKWNELDKKEAKSESACTKVLALAKDGSLFKQSKAASLGQVNGRAVDAQLDFGQCTCTAQGGHGCESGYFADLIDVNIIKSEPGFRKEHEMTSQLGKAYVLASLYGFWKEEDGQEEKSTLKFRDIQCIRETVSEVSQTFYDSQLCPQLGPVSDAYVASFKGKVAKCKNAGQLFETSAIVQPQNEMHAMAEKMLQQSWKLLQKNALFVPLLESFVGQEKIVQHVLRKEQLQKVDMTIDFSFSERQRVDRWAQMSLAQSADELAGHFIYQEWKDYLKGYLSSASLEEYERVRSLKGKRKLSRSKLQGLKNQLGLFVSAGVDFVIGKAQAQENPQVSSATGSPASVKVKNDSKGVMGAMGVFASLAGIGLATLSGLVFDGFTWLDKIVGLPSGRMVLFSLMFFVIALVIGATSLNYTKLAGQRNKIAQIYKKMAGVNTDEIILIDESVASFTNRGKTALGAPNRGGQGIADSANSGANQAFNPALNAPASRASQLPPGTPCIGSGEPGNCSNLPSRRVNKAISFSKPGSVVANNVSSQVVSTANQLNQGNLSAALTTQAAIAGNKKAVLDLIKNTKNKLNNLLKSQGEKAIDFKKLEQTALRGIQQQTAKSLKRQKTPLNVVSRLFGIELDKNANLNAVVRSNFEKASSKNSSAGQVISSSKKNNRRGRGGIDPFDQGSFEGVNSARVDRLQELKHDEGMGAYSNEGDTSDVHDQADVSIFRILSHRYMKTALPHLLKRRRAVEENSR